MSLDNNPNLNAVGVFVDIFESLQRHVRGNAREAGKSALLTVTVTDIADFAHQLSSKLDQEFGREK